MEEDVFKTIKESSSGFYSEKRSKFYAFAHPVCSVEEAKEIVDSYRHKHYSARHVCWAYMIGPERECFRAYDDGEPSSTAGKPILGQLNTNALTNCLIVVVRYYGGVPLGTGGLLVAYRTAAAEALAKASIIEKTVDEDLYIFFEYAQMNGIMRIIKEEKPEVVSQRFEMTCEMKLRIRKGKMACLRERLKKVPSCRLKD